MSSSLHPDEVTARLRLSMTSGIGPVLLTRLLETFGTAQRICNLTAAELRNIDGITLSKADKILQGIQQADPSEELRLIKEHGVTLLCLGQPEYPPLLKHISDPPPILYVRGALERRDTLALAVVGARDCTAYGREQADRLAALCASAGLTIVSGGARGIDTAAHRGALRANGRTLAVMGCGLTHTYPPENEQLFAQITGSGALISEFPMTMPPRADHFPRRNRIISGLSLGTLVVEASARSGALITARLASEDHNREVLAVPGRVDSPASAGCHKIIREGWATLVTSAADILQALGEPGQALLATLPQPDAEKNEAPMDAPLFRKGGTNKEKDTAPLAANLPSELKTLFEAIGREPTEIDQLAQTTGLNIGRIQGHLTTLQLQGLIERAGGNRVRRK